LSGMNGNPFRAKISNAPGLYSTTCPFFKGKRNINREIWLGQGEIEETRSIR
jgi:hypothetical protein